MAAHYTDAEAETIRAFVRKRRRRRKRALAARLAKARRDCDAIVARIAGEISPERIYIWGSLVRPEYFSERSDLDIAVEGAADPIRLYELAGELQRQTAFDLDIVRMESVHPAYADHIRRRGMVVHERQANR